jgi:hypothetical protein
MKKIIFYLILLLLVFQEVVGQKYHKFPTSADKPVWGQLGTWVPPPVVWVNLYGMIGDTVIINKTSSKLYLLKDSILSVEKAKKYLGSIREDSNKRVYLVDTSTHERLLFDFSKKVGEWIDFKDYIFDSLFLFDIDSVQLNDGYYREYYTGGNDSQAWIEGIGGRNDIFEPKYYETESGTLRLSCFKRNDRMIFGKCDCLFHLMTGINKNGENVSEIHIFPNPASNEIFFDFSNSTNIEKLTIYNSNGGLQNEIVIKKMNQVKVNVEQYAPGLYFYIVQGKKSGSVGGKFVVE